MLDRILTRADLNERNEYAASDSLHVDGSLTIPAELGTVYFRGSLTDRKSTRLNSSH